MATFPANCVFPARVVAIDVGGTKITGLSLIHILVVSIVVAIAAVSRKWVSEVIMRICDIVMSFPGIALAATFVLSFGASIPSLIFAIGFLYIDVYKRQEVVDDLLGHVADGTHGDDDTVGVGGAVVVEELVVGAQLLVDLVHILLHHGGQSGVIAVAGLPVLEEEYFL